MSSDPQHETPCTPDLATMRVSYASRDASHSVAGPGPDENLDPTWLEHGWLTLLRHWVEDAVEAALPEPNAMVLATVDADGHPATRTVLCKGLSADGVLFFTNYDSNKGRHLSHVPYASVTFVWLPLARQVTVRGSVQRVSPEMTAEYWHGRPRGSQLGAWASHQSQPIGSRAELEQALVDVAEHFSVDTEIPVPPHWGGFLIHPDSVEFWQGRVNRLHNRVRTRLVDGAWIVERLQP